MKEQVRYYKTQKGAEKWLSQNGFEPYNDEFDLEGEQRYDLFITDSVVYSASLTEHEDMLGSGVKHKIEVYYTGA